MTKLEDKIIKKVYQYETKRTVWDVLIRSLAILFFGSIFVFFLISVVEALQEQETFDVFIIFFQNIDEVKDHLGEIFQTLSYEIPYFPLLLSAISFIIVVILIVVFVRRSKIIKKKVKSIIKYRSNL